MNTTTKGAVRPPKNTELSLRVEFTRDELFEIAKKQNEVFGELTRAEDEKKSVGAQLKAKCDGLSSRLAELGAKFSAGYEYRPVPCSIVYDDPKPGMKTTYRLDTDTVVNVKPMTGNERQAELPLGGDASKVVPFTPSVGDQVATAIKEAGELTVDSWDAVSTENVNLLLGTKLEVSEENLNKFAEFAYDVFFDSEMERRSESDSRSEMTDYITECAADSSSYSKLVRFLEANRQTFPGAELLLKYAGETIKALGLTVDEATSQIAEEQSAEEASEETVKRTRTKITDEVTARVVELTNAGRTVQEIAADTGLSIPSIYNIRKSRGLVKARGTSTQATPRMVGPDGCVATPADGDINPTEDECKQ